MNCHPRYMHPLSRWQMNPLHSRQTAHNCLTPLISSLELQSFFVVLLVCNEGTTWTEGERKMVDDSKEFYNQHFKPQGCQGCSTVIWLKCTLLICFSQILTQMNLTYTFLKTTTFPCCYITVLQVKLQTLSIVQTEHFKVFILMYESILSYVGYCWVLSYF